MIKRLMLVIGGLLFTITILEIVLQLLALLTTGARLPQLANDHDTVRILCIGDSNTYGVYAAPGKSYPAQLESILNANRPRRRYAVINAGCPGHPSTALALELPSLLERYQPEIVIALGGINDRWDDRGRAEVLKLTGASWNPLRQSRLLKLIKIIHTRIVTKREVSLSDPNIENRYLAPKHDEMLADDALHATIVAALSRVVDLSRTAAAVPVLLTYPAHERPFLTPQGAIRAAAEQTGATLVDLQTTFEQLEREGRGSGLLIANDWHPTTAGYGVIAQELANRLVELGLVDQVPDTSDASLTLPLTLGLETATDQSGRVRHQLVIDGEPSRSFRVLLSGSTTPPFRLYRVVIPLRYDPLFEMALKLPGLTGKLDEQGRARMALDSPSLASMRPNAGKIFACAITLRDRDPSRHPYWSVLSVSAAIGVRE